MPASFYYFRKLNFVFVFASVANLNARKVFCTPALNATCSVFVEFFLSLQNLKSYIVKTNFARSTLQYVGTCRKY